MVIFTIPSEVIDELLVIALVITYKWSKGKEANVLFAAVARFSLPNPNLHL